MKIPLKIMAGLILFVSFAFTACAGADSGDLSGTDGRIGKTGPGGGIIFYVEPGTDGLHGLEAAPSLWDGGTGDLVMEWSNVFPGEIGVTARGTAAGTGFSNSNAIVNQASHTGSAAKKCRDYRGGNLSDWYLPSKEELSLMYTNLKAAGLSSFNSIPGCYWSSSEQSSTTAWGMFFDNGDPSDNGSKSNICSVRPIREF